MVPSSPRILRAGSCGQAGSDAHRDSASAGAVPDRRDPWSSRAKDFSALNLTGTLCMWKVITFLAGTPWGCDACHPDLAGAVGACVKDGGWSLDVVKERESGLWGCVLHSVLGWERIELGLGEEGTCPSLNCVWLWSSVYHLVSPVNERLLEPLSRYASLFILSAKIDNPLFLKKYLFGCTRS